jgi:ABC-2 type transport system permease protein
MNYTSNIYYVALFTIVRREIIRIIRIWPQTLLPAVITTALYFLIFGSLLGKQISSIKGYSYIEYITPGLIMLGVINNSYSNVVTSFFGAKFQHHIEELLIAPLPSLLILIGYALGGVLRGVFVGVLITIVALFFGKVHTAHLGIIIYVLIMTALLFSLAGLINGLFARSFDETSIVPTFILTPLTYLGGIFFTIDMLPSFGQKLAMLNPITYMINAFRYSLLGIEEISIYLSLGIITGLCIILFLWAWRLLSKGFGIKN